MSLVAARLTDLATRHKSDKWGHHWFAEIYQQHFEFRRHERLNLLEIGIGGQADPEEACGTLRMWEEYFPAATIYGLDKRLKASFSKGRIVTIEGSQTDEALLRAICEQAGGFDIVIDNGSHITNEVLLSFSTLFPYLTARGIYAIECLQTSYWPLYGGNSNELNRMDTSVGFLKSLADGLNYQERIAPGYQPSYLDEHVVAVHFHHNIALVEKGANASVSNVMGHNMPKPGCEDICNGRAGTPTTAISSSTPGFDQGPSLINSFCLMQLAHWKNRAFSFEGLSHALDVIAVTHYNVFVYEIDNNEVIVHRSAQFQALLDAGQQHESARRAETYRSLFREAVALHPLPKRIVLAVDVGDEAPQEMSVPMFSFQKRVGEVNVLLPDMEIVGLSYLESVATDPHPFDQKRTRAVFTGSTSGKHIITMEDIDNDSVPRLRAARFFKDKDGVDFSLTNVVQCESEAVAQRLRADGHGKGWVNWFENFQNKFLISIDGNGAPCSRPAIILRSNSVLLKYQSNNILYYSSGLVPWQHYIPVAEDREILSILQQETSQPGTFAHIAESSRNFANTILNRGAILAYTGKVLLQYSSLLID